MSVSYLPMQGQGVPGWLTVEKILMLTFQPDDRCIRKTVNSFLIKQFYKVWHLSAHTEYDQHVEPPNPF